MINYLKQSPVVVRSCVENELKKAMYWFEKQSGKVGTVKRYARDKKLRREHIIAYGVTPAVNARQYVSTDIITYVNPLSRNRWMMLENCTYTGDGYNFSARGALVVPTESHITLYIYGDGTVFIFTPHFFRQFCDRKGIPFDVDEVVSLFLNEYYNIVLKCTEADLNHRRQNRKLCEFYCVWPDAEARGVRLSKKAEVYEMRTFIPTTMLNSLAKYKHTHTLRFIEQMKSIGPDVVKSEEHIIQMFRAMGAKHSQAKIMYHIHDMYENIFEAVSGERLTNLSERKMIKSQSRLLVFSRQYRSVKDVDILSDEVLTMLVEIDAVYNTHISPMDIAVWLDALSHCIAMQTHTYDECIKLSTDLLHECHRLPDDYSTIVNRNRSRLIELGIITADEFPLPGGMECAFDVFRKIDLSSEA